MTTELREMTWCGAGLCAGRGCCDRRFVAPTWAQGAKWRADKNGRFAIVDRLLARRKTRVVVYANGPTVHAWAAGANGTLFYAYVAPELRGEGLARKVISKLLWGYPETIPITHPWPWASERFRFTHAPRLRTAA